MSPSPLMKLAPESNSSKVSIVDGKGIWADEIPFKKDGILVIKVSSK